MTEETREPMQHIVDEFVKASDIMELKINVKNSNMLVVKKDQLGTCEKVRVREEEMQEVDKFNYL